MQKLVWPISGDVNRYGIENLKKVLAYAAKAARYTKDCLKDGKFSLWEAIGSVGILREGVDILSHTAQILTEFKDLNESEILELVKHIGNELGESDMAKAKRVLDEIALPAIETAFLLAGIAKNANDIF